MFEEIDEWFAIRNKHSDDDIWPAKLRFSEKKGVIIDAVCFSGDGKFFKSPDCDTGTITGYLDYQRPTTVVKPWVQSQIGGGIGVDTPVVRAKARLLASALLKNMHLCDPSEKCFTALYAEMPAFNSWFAPQLVKTDFDSDNYYGPPAFTVEIDRPFREEFNLNDDSDVVIQSFAGTTTDNNTTTVTQRTWLTFEFSEAIDLSEIQKRIWRVNTLFSFLLGHQMAQSTYRLKTTHTRQWNGNDNHVTAELLFRPVFESAKDHVEWHDALFTRPDCAIGSQELLKAACERPDSLFYLMYMVLLMERPKKLSASDFSELLGCIEDFDISIYGSGSSKQIRSARRAVRKLVQAHGTDDELNTLDDLIEKQPNRLTLAERIDRLQADWAESGFRGKPSSAEIVKIRNDISHGRGAILSTEDYQKIVLFSDYLCALSRFHVFKLLGIPVRDIGSAFGRMAYMYGKYAPLNEDKSQPNALGA